jgi:hypothetical protein
MPLIALVILSLLISLEDASAEGAPATPAMTESTVPTARAKPTAAEKRCLASRRRVERQHEVIAEADARLAKERKARESCKTKRTCDNLDRALKASETRQQRHAKQLEQFESEARKACAPLADAPKPTDYRSSTAVTSNPTTTNPNSTK